MKRHTTKITILFMILLTSSYCFNLKNFGKKIGNGIKKGVNTIKKGIKKLPKINLKQIRIPGLPSIKLNQNNLHKFVNMLKRIPRKYLPIFKKQLKEFCLFKCTAYCAKKLPMLVTHTACQGRCMANCIKGKIKK